MSDPLSITALLGGIAPVVPQLRRRSDRTAAAVAAVKAGTTVAKAASDNSVSRQAVYDRMRREGVPLPGYR